MVSINILQEKKYYHLIKKKSNRTTKFTYSPWGKAFEKQIKTIEDQEKKKQINALKDLKLKEQTKVIEDKSNKISSRLLEKELMKYK